jgi:hypothetical protein
MITGGYAFEGSSFGDLLVSICTDPLPRLGDRAPWASAALEKWFQRACARDLDQRFQSADEMIDELHAAANLSFDGRMSFVEENSGLTQLAVSERALQTFWASDTAGEANNTQAIAATHHASELATNTGDASVHTIPGIPEKRRWLVPALMGGAVLVLGAAFIWFTTSGDADAANVRALELSAASELSESGATRSPKDATLPLASSKTLERVKADIATGDKKSAIAEQEAKAAETSDAKSRFKSRAETKSARAESVVKASTKSSKLSVKPKKPPVATPKAVTGKSQSAELDIGF